MANYYVIENKETGRWDIQKEGCTHPSISSYDRIASEHLAEELVSITGGGEVILYKN